MCAIDGLVGAIDGLEVGAMVGLEVGADVVGVTEGLAVVGDCVGAAVSC